MIDPKKIPKGKGWAEISSHGRPVGTMYITKRELNCYHLDGQPIDRVVVIRAADWEKIVKALNENSK